MIGGALRLYLSLRHDLIVALSCRCHCSPSAISSDGRKDLVKCRTSLGIRHASPLEVKKNVCMLYAQSRNKLTFHGSVEIDGVRGRNRRGETYLGRR